jgi:sterol desaturase/sphingolipid hydroxylase (fatty acid hydroxylase superfamily)
MTLVLPSALLLLLVAIEALVLRLVKRQDVPWNQIVFNLNSGHTILWLFRGVEIAVFHAAHERFNLGWIEDWSPTSQFIVALVGWDFCFYWLHRMHHHLGALWAVHVVHHEGDHFSLSLGIRNSWYSSMTSIPFFLVLAVIGVPTEVFIAVGAVHYFVQFYNHNGIVKKSGLLEYIMVTPSHHRVHHGKNAPYLNRNFGGTLVFWDKIFGTFQAELDDIPVQFGTNDHVATDNIFWANNLPWLKLFRIQLPQLQPPLYRLKGTWMWTAGLLSFAILLQYIHAETAWPLVDCNLLLVYGAAAAISIGGLAEGRKWGKTSWTVIHLIALSITLTRAAWQEPMIYTYLILANSHAASTWLRSSWAKAS